MMYEMKNLFSPSEQGEGTDKAFLTVAASVSSKRHDRHTLAVTWEGAGMSLGQTGESQGFPPSRALLGPEGMWPKGIQHPMVIWPVGMS